MAEIKVEHEVTLSREDVADWLSDLADAIREGGSAELSLSGPVLTLPLAMVNQPFTAPKEKRGPRTDRFLRNLASVGAALIAGVDLEGRPGLSWRVQQIRAARAEAKGRGVFKV